MRFTARAPLGILAVILMVGLIQAAPMQEAMTKQVLSASPDRTEMTMSFNETAVLNAISGMDFNQKYLDGYGAVLAMRGSEAPSVHVLRYELGTAVPAGLLDLDEVPASAADMIFVSEPAIMHGLQVVSVGVSPVMRDSKGVARTVRDIDFAVEASGHGANNLDAPAQWSQAFEPLFRTTVDNLDELFPNRSLAKPGRYLVLGQTDLLNRLQNTSVQYRNWLDLKRQKGYSVVVKTLFDVFTAIGDSTDNSIRQYFANEYQQTWGGDLEYVVLIGDISGTWPLPSKFLRNPEQPDANSVGDNFYFTVDGADYIPDIFHGRISAQSVAEYASYFAKAVAYERDPYRDEMHWFQSATCVAGNFSDGSGTFPVTPVWNMNWTREAIMRDGCITDADTFYIHDITEPPGDWRIPIRNDIEAGVCAVFYRGWASQQLWQYPRFYNEDIEAVFVDRMNPAVFGVVCGSGDFVATQCMGEVWTTGVGTVSDPNGAIIYYGASDLHTNTRHNNAMLAGIIRALQDGIRSGAALALAGKMEVYRQFPLELGDEGFVHFYGFHVFNLLGDPETQIYFCTPGELHISHDPLSPGQNLANFTIRDGGNLPVANAIVTLRAGTSEYNIAGGLTNEMGEIALPADLAAGVEAQMYAWKAGYFSAEATQSISSDPFDPRITSVTWDAGSDNLPNPGETANFSIVIENRGSAAFTPSCTVTSDDDRINVTSATAAGSEVSPGGSVTVGPFTIELNGHPLPDGLRPLLNVAITDESTADRTIEVPVSAPDPTIWSVTVNDGDGILSPGETATVTLSVVNRGSLEGSVSCEVTSHDNGITITNGSVSFGNLPIGQIVTSTNDFTASIPGDATPGRQIVLRFAFEMNGVEFTNKLKLLVAGAVADTIPTGPDGYGYYAYEDIDAGYGSTPVYNWIELNPDSGGTSDNAYEMRDDTHAGLPLPTPFTFYGQSFDSIWVCSNGWLSFGRAMIPEFRNWEIPSPIGPPAMVCPFWDDLISYVDNVANNNSIHYIWTKHSGNQFIVQWQTLNRRGLEGATGQNPSTDFCTFEVILEYGTGDGSILCQYKQISNIDNAQNYATIGIQDFDHRNGLGLTYANSYIASVDTICAERAIRFTTTPPDAYLGQDDPAGHGVAPLEFALHPAFPNPFNPTTELRFDLTANALTTLRVYDILGRETATLLNGTMTAGTHTVQFNAGGLPSGLYLARLTSGENVAVQKLMLLK